MATSVKWMESAKHLIVVCDEKEPCVLLKTDPRYKKALDLIHNMDKEALAEFLFPGEAIVKKYEGNVEIRGNQVLMDGQAVTNAITKYIFDFYKSDLDINPLVNFWKKIQNNPDKASREQLFLFLEYHKAPLTPDGCFLMYKGVKRGPDGHFYDKYTGKFRNDVGDIVSMDRSQVDSNRNVSCSRGLHVATYGYANGVYGGDVILECKIDPSDVVSVPSDYDNQKMRVCRYEVISVGQNERKDVFLPWDIIKEIHTNSKATQEEDIKKKVGKGKDINIGGLSASQIVNLVTEKTGERITLSLKSKRSIEKKARDILRDFGFNIRHCAPQEETPKSPSKKKTKKVSIRGLSAREIVDLVAAEAGYAITLSLKSKRSIEKKAREVLRGKGFKVEG